ncbi:hypothetical protein V9L05_19510 [Bernardetia sp. Wsw4-3y2]|uniref:hypothetical protein n=1 Tax=Bernardetia sp. Wsw4-3y2 TaxID=3127471 RepID=UPI0030D32879
MLYQNTRKTFLIEEVILTDKTTSESQEAKQQKVLKLYLIGRLTVEEHREGFETYLELFKDGNYSHAIFDYLKLEYDPPQSRAWFVTNYVPRYGRELKERECYLALLESQNLFQKMTTSLITSSVQKIYKTIHISFFKKLEEGEKWLLNQ